MTRRYYRGQEFDTKPHDAVFINLDPETHNQILNDQDDIWRNNTIKQTLVETEHTKAMKGTSLELHPIKYEDAEGLQGNPSDKQQAMKFLVKFRKRLAESKAKIEQNRKLIVEK